MGRDGTRLTEDVIGAQVDALMNDVPTQRKAERSKRKRTPHERDRAQRRMTITLPYPEWRDAVGDRAEAWNLNVSDFVTFCLSYTMAAIEAGELERPAGQREVWHRSGEMLDLPWEPE